MTLIRSNGLVIIPKKIMKSRGDFGWKRGGYKAKLKIMRLVNLKLCIRLRIKKCLEVGGRGEFKSL